MTCPVSTVHHLPLVVPSRSQVHCPLVVQQVVEVLIVPVGWLEWNVQMKISQVYIGGEGELKSTGPGVFTLPRAAHTWK